MNRLIKLAVVILDELRDIWHTRNERTRIILYQTDGWLLALVTLGRCAIGDTISSVTWRLEQQRKFWGWLRPVIDWVFLHGLGEVDHCHSAHQKFLRITGSLKPETSEV